jgi:eukaryotic-like serine/threonine-protein kinase
MRRNLGPYQLVGLLGIGGFAQVHLAIAHGASGFERKVAIKTLREEVRGDARCERGLVWEANIAARLHHRNLIYVHGFGIDEGTYYLVMEYVDGGDLHGAVMPEPLALHVACEIALGLGHVHAARDDRGLPLGLIHRDLTPTNVLVSRTGDVKLGDLGIAKATTRADRTEAGALRGTYSYMAPEQVEDRPCSQATDQWALAIVLAELLTGERVFAGETPLVIMENILRGPGVLAGIAPDVAAVIETATARESTHRFASIDEMRRVLESVRRTREPAGAAELAEWVSARRPA